jgi:hypothetical protein
VYDICVRTADAGSDARGKSRALGFYHRLGFHRLEVADQDPVVYLGRPFHQASG